jgi:kinesin family protein 1
MTSNSSLERTRFPRLSTDFSGHITKAGPVAVWNLSKNEWTRKFLALRRPYLYLYSSPSDLDEEAVMSVFALRLDHGERISDMLRVQLLEWECADF